MIEEMTMTEEAQSPIGHGGKFLTFYLKDEEYGIEILKVQEIIGMLPITRVPETSEFIRGVINLRGKIIPIMDLRQKFKMNTKDDDDDTCVIVVQTEGVEIGVVVDKVSEVLDIKNSEIEDVPAFGTEVNTNYLLGVGKTNDKVRLLLDIDCVLSKQELEGMKMAAEGNELAVA